MAIGVDGPRAVAGPGQVAIVRAEAVLVAEVAIAIAGAQVQDSAVAQAGAAHEAPDQAGEVLEGVVPGVVLAEAVLVAEAVPEAVALVGAAAVPASVAVLPAAAEALAAQEAPAAVRDGTRKVGPSQSPG